MQLIMEESSEFKSTKGLGLVQGNCFKFDFQKIDNHTFPVPNIGWNKINQVDKTWKNTLLCRNEDRDYMYFVHSFYVETEQKLVTTYSNYGKYEYCSSLRCENIHAMQFHPEKSGERGLKVYSSLSEKLEK
jgi:glutamine amidotransferase